MSNLVRLLSAASGLSESDILTIIATAPSRYKTYTIPKRSGGRRVISQPSQEVKFLQRIFVEEILSKAPIHPAAMAYRRGLSISDNARAHVNNDVILKFDFKNFFPSIVETDWRNYCKANSILTDEFDIALSAKLLFWRRKYGYVLRLAIGAPSSPTLSNILMEQFDGRVASEAEKESVTYTRYADDLTFSAKRAGYLMGIEKMLRKVIREMKSPRLILNEEKTVLSTKKYRRVVTGLVLADDGKVSLGRDRKRTISATIHRFVSGKLDLVETEHLAGLLAFAGSVEPEFLERMSLKYGSNAMGQLKNAARRINIQRHNESNRV